jgi:hypothetical protein
MGHYFTSRGGFIALVKWEYGELFDGAPSFITYLQSA